MGLKKSLGIICERLPFGKLFFSLNLMLFHWKDRMHYKKKNKCGTKYLAIRALNSDEGMMSLFIYVLNSSLWAYENGFIPYVDFTNEHCQYYTGREINGSKNAWEYFFKQPSDATKEDIDNAECLLLSGWSFKKKFKANSIKYTLEDMNNVKNKEFAKKYLPVNDNFNALVEQKYKELFQGKVLGVFIRGTDYVQIKPKGHYVQPSIEEVKTKIDEFMAKNTVNKIFVVTEDYSYFEYLKKEYGDLVFSSDDYFVKNYKKDDYLSSSFDNDKYERGANYLIRLLLLNKCDYLISSLTNGSLFLKLICDKKYEDEHWFELGKY